MFDPNLAFTLRLQPFNRAHDPHTIVIRAFDELGWDSAGRIKLTVEVRHGGKVIFPRGFLTCAVHGTSDGIAARELVCSLVGMRPGDTDEDYFAGYSADQLAWAKAYGEHVSMIREGRYCDHKTGSVRS